jgi:amino acid transporter
LTAQLELFFYIFMFAAAIRLRYKYSHVQRSYKIPGGKYGIWLVGGIGIFACIVTIILGFIPPTQVVMGKTALYETILIVGMILFFIPPFFLHMKNKR